MDSAHALPEGRTADGAAVSQFTIWIIARQRRGLCEANANGMSWSHDRTWLQNDGGRRGLPMYDVRRTMYDLDYSARCAGKRPVAVSAYGQRRCAAHRANWQWGASESTYDLRLEKRLADGSRVKKAARRVKRCNAPAGEILSMNGHIVSLTTLEHRMMEKSTQKISPGACPLAGTGREATYNNSWQIRNRASIPHSTSRGLVASVFTNVCFMLKTGFCRTGAGSLTQSNG